MYCIFYNPKTELIEVIEKKKIPADEVKFILKNAGGGAYEFKSKYEADKRLLKYPKRMVNPVSLQSRQLVKPMYSN